MATKYLVEIIGWDQALHLSPSPGGIPEEHTFQGELIFVRHLEIEGRVRAPSRHRDKRVRVWLSELWPPETSNEPVGNVGNVEERTIQGLGQEFVVSLFVPQTALAPAAICLGSCWKHLRMTTVGRGRARAKVIEFSFSRLET